MVHRLDNFLRVINMGLLVADLDEWRWEHSELDEIVKDYALNAVVAKEVIDGKTLIDGIAMIGFEIMCIRAFAALQAQNGCRQSVFAQDVTDGLVTIRKIIRDQIVQHMLRSFFKRIRHIFYENIELMEQKHVWHEYIAEEAARACDGNG